MIIFASITVIQVIITQWTQDVFKVSRTGLNPSQWLFSFAVGLSIFPIDALIKFIPDKLFCDLSRKKKHDPDEGQGWNSKEENKENAENGLKERSSGENHPLNSANDQ